MTTTGHKTSAKVSAIIGHTTTTGQESSATLGQALAGTGNAKPSLRNNPRTRSISPIAGPSCPRQAILSFHFITFFHNFLIILWPIEL
jgi:hypothetical protein